MIISHYQPYKIIFYFTASPANARVLEELVRKGKKTLDAPKPVYYFHVEYELVPTMGVVEADIVTYAIGAKVFFELLICLV